MNVKIHSSILSLTVKMTTALLKRMLLSGAKKSFPKVLEQSKNLLKKYIGPRAKKLAIDTGKKIGREALKRLNTKVQQKAKQYKSKNFATEMLYDEMFTKRNILEEALNQMGGQKRRRSYRNKRKSNRKKQRGGIIYYKEPSLKGFTPLEIEAIRRQFR